MICLPDKINLTDEYAAYIRDLVYRAGLADNEYKIFGANSHKYKLNPVIPLSTVKNYEKQYNIKLPDEYIFFLTKIGNGGAGPDYGIYPLEDSIRYTPYLIGYTPDEAKNMPVFLNKSMTKDEWNKKTDILENMDDDEYDKYERTIYSGQLEIGTEGCSGCMTLMIKGEYYGEIVLTNLDLYMPQFTDMTFMQWYEKFFDWIVKGYDTHFIYSVNSLTEKEIISAYNPLSDFNTRYNLLSGLKKYKSISDETIQFLYSIDDLELYELVSDILFRAANKKSLNFFEKLLNSENCQIAVKNSTLMPNEYRDKYYNKMIELLYDDNISNKWHILYFVENCKNLNIKDIMPYILNSNNPIKYRETALFVIKECKNISDASEDFIKLFNDDNDSLIIKTALYCIYEHKIPDLVPSYKKLLSKYKDNREIKNYLKRAFIVNNVSIK